MSDLIHYKPSEYSYNVRCLNGSAHALRTQDITRVTCKLCRSKKHNKTWWDEHFKKVELGREGARLTALTNVIYEQVYLKRVPKDEQCEWDEFNLIFMADYLQTINLSKADLKGFKDFAEKNRMDNLYFTK